MIYYTQPVTIQLAPVCLDRGVYLRWLSPLGHWEGWFFDGQVDDATALDNPTSYRPGRATLAVARPGVATQQLRTSNLTAAQHQALTTLLDSPQVYRQYPNGQLVPVYVVPGGGTRTSADTRHEFEVTIELPRRNALSN